MNQGVTVLTQIVLLKWTESATSEQRSQAANALASLPGLVSEIRTLALVTDAGLRPDNFDVAVVTSFEDQAAWEKYQTHPEHLRVVKGAVAPILAAKAAVQLTGSPAGLAAGSPDE